MQEALASGETRILGSPPYDFRASEGWGAIPAEIELGDVAGIAIDTKDQVYLFNRGKHPVVVLDQVGTFKTSWGHGLFANAHGAHIGADQCIYLTDNGNHTVRKFSLDGKLLLSLGTQNKPAPFMSGKPFCRCTHTALSYSYYNRIYLCLSSQPLLRKQVIIDVQVAKKAPFAGLVRQRL